MMLEIVKRLRADKRFRDRVLHSILDHAIFLLTAFAAIGGLALFATLLTTVAVLAGQVKGGGLLW